MPPVIPALALLAALSLSPLASAEAVEPAAVTAEDRQTIASCLRESGDSPRACIGSIAVVCARRPDGERRDAEIACSRREAGVWRERLDAAAALLVRRLESGPRSRFAAAQRSWESFTAQDCAFLGEVQPPDRAPVMQAGCELRSVAQRAITVEFLARRTESPAPPRLER